MDLEAEGLRRGERAARWRDRHRANDAARPAGTIGRVAEAAGGIAGDGLPVMNGSTTVDAELADRVRAAAKALDYQPSLVARVDERRRRRPQRAIPAPVARSRQHGSRVERLIG